MYPATSATVIVSSPTRATTWLPSSSPRPQAARATSADSATARRKLAGQSATGSPPVLILWITHVRIAIPDRASVRGVMVDRLPTRCKRIVPSLGSEGSGKCSGGRFERDDDFGQRVAQRAVVRGGQREAEGIEALDLDPGP